MKNGRESYQTKGSFLKAVSFKGLMLKDKSQFQQNSQ